MTVLDRGTCTWGYAEKRFDPPLGLPMAGHSFAGKFGKSIDDKAPLFMRTLVLRPGESNEVIICFMDLLSGSVALLKKMRQLVNHERISLVGSHTHYAPGKYFGNAFYDSLAQPQIEGDAILGVPISSLLTLYAETIATTVKEARQSATRGRLGVIQSVHWGSGANRSIEAFQENFKNPDLAAWDSVGMPGENPPSGLSEMQKSIDPRVTTILAVDSERKHICAFSTAACHTTCMGPYEEVYSADWPGIAVSEFENAKPLGSEFKYSSAFALCAAGDVSSLEKLGLEMGGGEDAGQGSELKVKRGEEIGQHVAKVVQSNFSTIAEGPDDPINVTFKTMNWDPENGHNLKQPYPGWPLVAGAEDGHGKRVSDETKEGYSALTLDPPLPYNQLMFKSKYQYPKMIVFEFLLGLMRLTVDTLSVAKTHPICQIQIGSHVFLSAPGEMTTMAGYLLEKRIADSGMVGSASVLSNTNDYMGYITTPLEYDAQHYEGGHNLFGALTLASLRIDHRKLLAHAPSISEVSALEAADAAIIPAEEDEVADLKEQVVLSRQLDEQKQEIIQELKLGPVIKVNLLGKIAEASAFESDEPLPEELAEELVEVERIRRASLTKAQIAGLDAAIELSESQFDVHVGFLTDNEFGERNRVYLWHGDEVYESRVIANFGDIGGNKKDLRVAMFVLSGDRPPEGELKFRLDLSDDGDE